jgi:Siphovirus Gp157
MTSLIDLELERDLLVEQIMELTESLVTEEIAPTADPIDGNAELLLAKFEKLETAIADKVDAIAAVIAAQKGTIDYLKLRRDHFDRAIAVKTKALERFESYLKNTVAARPNGRIQGKTATISVVKNGGKQPLWIDPDFDEKKLPAEVITIVTTYKVDTEALRQKLAAIGEDSLIINGNIVAALQSRGTHLRIGG